MPGKLSTLRSHADAKLAALMADRGMTTRAIAEALGIGQKQVKPHVLLGHRLLDEEGPPDTTPAHGCGHMQGRGAA